MTGAAAAWSSKAFDTEVMLIPMLIVAPQRPQTTRAWSTSVIPARVLLARRRVGRVAGCVVVDI